MLDWDHLQSFLAIARHGNLSAARRAVRVTQTTMARRLETLHAQASTRGRKGVVRRTSPTIRAIRFSTSNCIGASP
jgi:DNA-binding transcriptional LysR family regulator